MVRRVGDECGINHNLWIAPGLCYVAQYMNDGWMLGEQKDDDSVCEEVTGNTTKKEVVLDRGNITLMAPKI